MGTDNDTEDNDDSVTNAPSTEGNSMQNSSGNENNSYNQYFRQNTQPITFDNLEVDDMEPSNVPNNVEIIHANREVSEQPRQSNNGEDDLDAESSDTRKMEKETVHKK